MQHTFRHWDGAEYERLLKTLSLPDNKPFRDFSRGMKMKLSIAIAMSHHATLLTGGMRVALPLLCAAGVVLYALSWYWSIRLYEKREVV